jgi:magnesium transporter
MLIYLRSVIHRATLKPQDTLQPGTWVRCERPSKAELGILTDLGLDVDIMYDALDPYEVPRVESEGEWAYFISRLPEADHTSSEYTTPIMFAINDKYIVTLSRDVHDDLWQPFIEKVTTPSTQKIKFFMHMVNVLVMRYDRQVALVNKQVRGATVDLHGLRSHDIATFSEYERRLNDYLDALIPTNIAVEKMLSGGLLKIFAEDKDEVEDLSIDLEQLIARCKSHLRTITNLRDSYRAVMDTRLNETLRTLTVITVALTIPTMVAGLFGMNVDLPGDINSPHTFWIIFGFSVFSAVVLALYFRWRK